MTRSISSRGFLSLVDGTQRYKRGDHYLRMVKGLIRSVKQYDSSLAFAVITDSSDKELAYLADEIITPKHKYGMGTIQKLYLDLYTPFAETIFIEADCLLYADPHELWQLMGSKNKSFSMQRQGNFRFTAGDGNFSINNTKLYLQKCGIDGFYHSIGGLFYFRKDDVAKKIFSEVRTLYERRDEIGLKALSKQIAVADETLFSTALEMHGLGTQEVKDVLWQEELRLLKISKIQVRAQISKRKAELLRVNSYGTKGALPRVLIMHFSAREKFAFVYLCQVYELYWQDKLNRKTSDKTGPSTQYGSSLNLLIILLAMISALVPYLVLQKRWWWDYRFARFRQTSKDKGLAATLSDSISKGISQRIKNIFR